MWGSGPQTLELLSPCLFQPLNGPTAFPFPLFCWLEHPHHQQQGSHLSGLGSASPTGLSSPQAIIFCLFFIEVLSLSFALLPGSRHGFNHCLYYPLLMLTHYPISFYFFFFPKWHSLRCLLLMFFTRCFYMHYSVMNTSIH